MNNRRTITLIAIFLALAAVYVVFFSGWFARPQIGIMYRLRVPAQLNPRLTTMPVMFALDRDYRLSSIEVVGPIDPDSPDTTGAAALWRLVGAPRSEPARNFGYGHHIVGMKPADDAGTRRPLEPDQTYRLIVRAGRARGRIDFQTRPLPVIEPNGAARLIRP